MTEINVYRLPLGLSVGEVVRVVSWDINYVVEKDGHRYIVSQINIVTPYSDLWGNFVCPDCSTTMSHRGAYWICPGCPFRCLASAPASVVSDVED